MKKAAPTECVSLSDSLPSPRPSCNATQAMVAYEACPPKVVCLDSDTESDGSYTHLGLACSVPKEAATGSTAGKSCIDDYEDKDDSWLSATASAAGKSCIGRHGEKDAGWFALRTCSAKRKSWSPTLSITPEKVEEPQEVLDRFIKGAEVSTLSSPKWQDDPGSHEKESGKRLVLQKCSIGRKIWSPSLSLSSGNECDLDKPQLGGTDDYFTSLSFEEKYMPKEYHKTLAEGQETESGSMCGTLCPSVSACFEDRQKSHVEEKSLDHGKQINSIHLDIDSSPSASFIPEHLSELHKPKKECDVFRFDSACSGFISSEPDDDSPCIPGWDDNLKSLSRNIKATNCEHVGLGKRQGHKANTAIDYSDEERGCGGSFLQKKDLSKTDSTCASVEASDDNDNVARKRPKKGGEGRSRRNIIVGGNNDMEFTRESERQRKVEERISKQQEKEIKKKQLQEEREKLRQEKEEEKKRLQEARRKRSEEDKRRKEELRAEAAEQRKVEREKEKWGKGKFALQSITVFVDTQILEGGLIGGHLLTRFAEKGFKYHLVKNPLRKTVLWQMNRPSGETANDRQEDTMLDASDDAESPRKQQDHKLSKKSAPQLSLKSVDVSYVLVVLEAEEFLDMVVKDVLDGHIKTVQKRYPGFTVCYLINKLMRHLHKREQQKYKNTGDKWVRPPVEQVLAQFVTSYDGVHSRLCLDEAEVAEHIVGLTRGLAECPFKRKLTPLSLSANGDHVVKNDPNSETIKKNVWLKALVAIPKVSGSCAIAIAKKYPSMSSLFNAYLDPSKTVYEKEHLLDDLMKEGLLGGEGNRRIGPACSRRIYRIMMAQQGSLFTEDVENGADYFKD